MDKPVTIYHYKGNTNILAQEHNYDDALKKIKDSFNKVLDGKNLSFLLGSGCSSFKINLVDDKPDNFTEVGIPTMIPLAKFFFKEVLDKGDVKFLLQECKIDVSDKKIETNIEHFLGVLHSYRVYLNTAIFPDHPAGEDTLLQKVDKIIDKARKYIIEKCLNESNRKSGIDAGLNALYEQFYRKLIYRNSNLPKANIFTTNYDLYSETALDNLGIHYVNGFSGGIKKYFNPTIFNYALAEKIDLSQAKWNVIDNFFYLYKIHGSINWIEDDSGSKLFRVRELQDPTTEKLQKQGTVMIHPTPLKQNASLGSPYSDLFREFQKKLMQNNNILITIGYSFSDEHINNIIFQAFTIPSFRLIIIGDPTRSKQIEQLQSLDDPRIWILGGILKNEDKLHYFNGFVENVLPDLSNDQIDNKIEEAIKKLLRDE
jgi:hypothetical protein